MERSFWIAALQLSLLKSLYVVVGYVVVAYSGPVLHDVISPGYGMETRHTANHHEAEGADKDVENVAGGGVDSDMHLVPHQPDATETAEVEQPDEKDCLLYTSDADDE